MDHIDLQRELRQLEAQIHRLQLRRREILTELHPPRKHVAPRVRRMAIAILSENGPMRACDLAAKIGVAQNLVTSSLQKLFNDGTARRVGHGIYKVAE